MEEEGNELESPKKVERSKVPITASIAVLMAFFIGQSVYIVSPAIAGIAAMYPNLPLSTITYVSTTISLASIPCTLIAGLIAGRKVRYKTLLMIAILCIAFGGALGYFTTSFPMLIVTRVIVGVGIGLSNPIGASVILMLYDKDKAARMNGFGMAMNNIAGVLLQILAGVLVGISLSYCWFLHLIVLIPLIIVAIWWKEPAKAPELEVKEDGKVAAKDKVPGAVWFFASVGLVLFMAYYALLLNMSSIVIGEGIGDAALAGTIGSMSSIGGMIAGFGFGPVYKLLGRKLTLPITLFVIMACLAIAYFSSNAIVLMICVLLSGWALFTLWPAIIMEFGNVVPESRITFANSMFSIFFNIGGFLASPFAAAVAVLLGTSPRAPLIAGAVVVAILGVVCFIYLSATVKKQPQEA